MKKENDFEHVIDELVTENDGAISKSKQKRLDRKKAASSKKVKQGIGKIVGITVGVLIAAFVVTAIVSSLIKAGSVIEPNGDYSAKLTENGIIAGVKASDAVSLCDYKSIEVPSSQVTYTDEEFKNVIDEILTSHPVITTAGEVKDGDKVSIDYVGTIDGVEFEGGNSQGNGSDLTIGSGTFVDDFEQQLIGCKPGETTVVNVTFPEDYTDAELAGKDAEFTVDIHGIYTTPELDDDFVCAYYSDHASTVAEFEQYLRDSYYDGQFEEYVETYLIDNSTVIKYPSDYLKSVKANTKYADLESYDYMNQMYAQYSGEGYSSFDEFTGMTDEEYEADVTTRSEETVKSDLVYQAILENEGIEMTNDDYAALEEMYGEDYLDTALESYGRGYLMRNIVRQKAVEVAKSYATVK